MTPAEREKFYDEHIAPELLRLGKLCQDNGLSMLATVQWGRETGDGTNNAGSTTFFNEETGETLRRAARVARGEHIVDAMAITITRDGKK